MKMLTDCPNDTKSIVMWSLTDGSEINRFTWSDDIVSFAWSRDGRLLAISDLSASLTLVDVMDDYRTLAQTTISEVCGMIKFSPDCRCLYALFLNGVRSHFFPLDINMENDGDFSLDVLPDQAYYHPWEFESCSETGFLLGDPFCLPSEGDAILSREPAIAFVLNEKSVLTVACFDSTIEMLQLDELTKESARVSITTARKVALSLSGDTLYVITTTDGSPATLVGWDISSGLFKPWKRVFEQTDWFNDYNLVAVREGVLLQTSYDVLELWNFELSDCIRSWTDLGDITKVIAISEERVAFEVKSASEEESEVIVVDTSRESIASTTVIDGNYIGCNSKCHVISAAHGALQMQCGDKVLWKISQPFEDFDRHRCATFSPTEQYCVFAAQESFSHISHMYVLDVVSGKTLRTLRPRSNGFPNVRIFFNFDCKFVGDEECIACFTGLTGRHFLTLFNVKSGDLLSEIALESKAYSLAACPRERLIAIGLTDSKVNFKVLQVKLPGDKHSRKDKRSAFINREQSYNTNTSIQPPERF